MTETSKKPTRAQLVSMIARLRGILISTKMVFEDHRLVLTHDDMLDPDEIDTALTNTTFDIEDDDLVDGGFDDSWEQKT